MTTDETREVYAEGKSKNSIFKYRISRPIRLTVIFLLEILEKKMMNVY